MEKLWFGAEVTLVGMVFVFVILLILSYLLQVTQVVIQKNEKEPPKQTPKQLTGQKAVNKLKDCKQPVGGQDIGEDLPFLCAAAVAAYLGNSHFTIKVIRRAPTDNAWRFEGRRELMRNLYEGGD